MEYKIYQQYRRLAIESRNSIALLRGVYRNTRVYIIGTGPSIQRTDLVKLNGEVVILMNNAVGLLDYFTPRTAYVVISDHLRAIELRKEIIDRQLLCIATTDKVLNPAVSQLIFATPFLFVMPKFNELPSGGVQVSGAFGFSDDLREGIYLGKSVVFPAIQVASYFGANRISLVGVDMSLGTQAPYFDQAIKSNWSDFRYARDGRAHFRVMCDCLRERHVILDNLTVGGRLDVLPHDPELLLSGGFFANGHRDE